MALTLAMQTAREVSTLPAIDGLAGRFTDVSVTLPEGTRREAALHNLELLVPLVNEAGPFWIGDTCLFLQEAHGMKLEQIAVEIKRPVSTLKKYARLARAFDECRRRHFLEMTSLSHMLEVLVFKTAEEQDHYLEQAALNAWPVKQLRREIAKVTKPFDEEEETLPVSVGGLEETGEDAPACLKQFFDETEPRPRPAPDASHSGMPSATMPDLTGPSQLSRRTDRETLESIQRACSAFLVDGYVRPPVLIDGSLYVASLGIEESERTGESKLLAFRVQERDWWERRPAPIVPLDEWRAEVTAGARKAHDLSGLCLPTRHTDPPMEYVFTNERVLFWCPGEAEEPGKPAEKRSGTADVSKPEPEIDRSDEPVDAIGITSEGTPSAQAGASERKQAQVKDWEVDDATGWTTDALNSLNLLSGAVDDVMSSIHPDHQQEYALYVERIESVIEAWQEALWHAHTNAFCLDEEAVTLAEESVPPPFAPHTRVWVQTEEEDVAGTISGLDSYQGKVCVDYDKAFQGQSCGYHHASDLRHREEATQERLPDTEQLFHAGYYEGRQLHICEEDTRKQRVDHCNDLAVLKDALREPHLQKAVKQRIEAKIRRLEK